MLTRQSVATTHYKRESMRRRFRLDTRCEGTLPGFLFRNRNGLRGSRHESREETKFVKQVLSND